MAQQHKTVGDPYAGTVAALLQAVEHAAVRWGVDPAIAGDVSLEDERTDMVAKSEQENGVLRMFTHWVDASIIRRFDAFVAAYEAAGAPYGSTVNGILRWHAEASA